MIGLLKLTGRGVVARCGYKYLRFEPGLTILPNRQVIVYKDKNYHYDSDKVYITFEEEDFIKETMSVIVLKNCKILNRLIQSGYCSKRQGFRNIILEGDGQPAPIVYVNRKGNLSERCCTFAYSDDNYKKFSITWNHQKSESNKTFESSDSLDNPQQSWDILQESTPDLFSFLQPQPRTSSILPQVMISQTFQNELHFKRFFEKYGVHLRVKWGINLSNLRTMDVIDLQNIDEIHVSNSQRLDLYPVFEVKPRELVFKGHGINFEVCKDISNNSKLFYYMLIEDCYDHRIAYNCGVTTLFLNNSVSFPFQPSPTQLVFFKLNKASVKKYLTNIIIQNLDLENLKREDEV